MLTRSVAVRIASRVGSKRSMSEGPKMHRARDSWATLENARPKDPHPHPVFEPPYNRVGAGVLVLGILCTGYGAMYNGMRHQQYKQGYWKKK